MKNIVKLFILALIMGNSFKLSAQEEQLKGEGIKAALLVIDVQKCFIESMDQSAVKLPIDMINGAIWLFNNQKLPIIYVYHEDKNNGPLADAGEFQFIDKIAVPGDATKVIKHYGNAFNKTELDKKLKELGCNTLFLCGLSATGCVMATYVGAGDLDYNVFTIKDALMSQDQQKTKMMEDIFDTIGIQAMALMLINLK